MKGSLMELEAAIRRNDVESIHREIAMGAPVNRVEKSYGYKTVLLTAVENELVACETLSALIDAGADPTLGAQELIARAAATGDLAKVKLFERHGSRLLGLGRSGANLLYHATWGSDLDGSRYELTEYLLNAGVDVMVHSGDLIGFCLKWNSVRALRLLLSHGVAASFPDWSPIFTGVVLGELDLVRAHGSQKESTINACGTWSPIQLAVRSGEMDAVVLLVELGADCSIRDEDGRDLFYQSVEVGQVPAIEWAFENVRRGVVKRSEHNALHLWAIRSGSVEVARWLVEHDIRPRKSDEQDETPIYQCRSVELLDFYLEQGAKVKGTKLGSDLLSFHAQYSPPEVVRRLLERGAKVRDSKYVRGALHHAVSRDLDELVDLLIGAGADLEHKDLDDQTPLCSARSLRVARKLLDAGADPDHQLAYAVSPRRWLLQQNVAFERLFDDSDSAASVHLSSEPIETLGSLMELRDAIGRNDHQAIQSEFEAGLPQGDLHDVEGDCSLFEEAVANPAVSIPTLDLLVGLDRAPLPRMQRLLSKAAQTGSVERVKYFEGLGSAVDYVDEHGYTVLHSAFHGSEEPPVGLIDYLIDSGVNPDQTSVFGETAIGYCFRSEWFGLARHLLDRGAMASHPDWPPIFTLILRRELEAIRAHKEQVNQLFFSFGPWLPLQLAILLGDVEMAQLLIDLGAQIDFSQIDMRYMLSGDIFDLAVGTGSVEMMEWAYAQFLEGFLEDRFLALHYAAASSGSVDAVRWLLDHGVEPDLGVIGFCQSPEMASVYLEHGVDPEVSDSEGTAVGKAVSSGSVEMARFFLERGADVEGRSGSGRVIHSAVLSGDDSLIDLIVGAGADLNSEDCNGDSPLCLANSLRVAKKLIDAGADPDQEHWMFGSVRNCLLKKDIAFSRIL